MLLEQEVLFVLELVLLILELEELSDVVEKLLMMDSKSIDDMYLKLETNVEKFLSKEEFRSSYIEFIKKYK